MRNNIYLLLLLLCCCVCFPQTVLADKTLQYSTLTVFMVDRSDKLSNPDQIKTICDLLEKKAAANSDGERVISVAITGKGITMRKLMDSARRQERFFTSTMKIRKDISKMGKAFSTLRHDLTDKEESHDSSAILETIMHASRIFQNDPMAAADKLTKKRLVIYSDMLQNSDSITFYGTKGKGFLADLDTTFSFLTKDSLMPDLQGVQTYIAGAGGNVSDSRGRQAEKFWRRLFHESGAEIKNYGPLLLAY